jgi:hypothetical protein
MKRLPILPIISAGVLLACLLCSACSLNRGILRTQLADKSEITGTYKVILYGANHYNDIATVALLIPEGSKYIFDIFAPDFNYRTITGLPAEAAVQKAVKFVGWHSDFSHSQTSRIIDVNGHAIGYEVRPLYRQTTFGMQDVMHVDYFLKDLNTVEVHIRLDDAVEMKFRGGADDHDGGQ